MTVDGVVNADDKRQGRLRRWHKLAAGAALVVVIAFLVVAFAFPPFRVALVPSETYPLTGFLRIETCWPHLMSVRFSVFAPGGDEILWGKTQWRSERIAILGETPGAYTVRARSGLRTVTRVQQLDDR